MLLHHLQEKHRCLFIVDADQDGFSSSAILWLYIKHIFPDANLSFSVHDHKQHGLDDKIEWLEDNPDYDLVICPDAASYDVEEHRRLGELGMDVLVLDHHEQLYDDKGEPIVAKYPNTIVVNNQLSENYSNKSLCGAGVVYKFCEVLDDILHINCAREYIDLAALGEIADVMDRTDVETNYIMLEGLRNIKNKGFKTLIEAQSYSLKEKAVYPYIGLTPTDIAFYISPLTNAITRVGTLEEKRNMFYCFVEPDRRVQSTKRGAKEGDTESAAEFTARVGKNAKSRQDRIKEQAMGLIDFKIQKEGLDQNNIIIVELNDEDNIPQELTGLVAMNVVSKYHKPCLIGRRNSKDELAGSVRNESNFAGLPSLKAFIEQSGYFNYAAGHDNACGYSINGNKIDAFIKYSNEKLNPEDFESYYLVDYVLDARDNNKELMTVLAEHPEYFGNHIDEIKLVVTNITLANILTMGTNKDSVRISFNGVDYVKFKDTDFITEILANRTKTLTIYGRVNLNTWMGKTSLQMFIEDYQLIDNNDKYEF